MSYLTEDRSHPLHFDVGNRSIVEDVQLPASQITGPITSAQINLGYEPKVYRVSQAGAVVIPATTTTLIPFNTLATWTILQNGSAYTAPTPSINANTVRLTGAKAFKGRVQFTANISTDALLPPVPPQTYKVVISYFDIFGTTVVSKTLPILKYSGVGIDCMETFEINFPYNAARTYCSFGAFVVNEQLAANLTVNFYSMEVIQDQ